MILSFSKIGSYPVKVVNFERWTLSVYIKANYISVSRKKTESGVNMMLMS